MRTLLAVAAAAMLSGCLSGGTLEPPAEVQLPAGRPPYTGPWPDIRDAMIRPGVQVLTPIGDSVGQCTSNFLFRTPDNATLYLGLAAHCFGFGDQVAQPGTVVTVGAFTSGGTVAYNGWADGLVPGHDFGLVELSSHPRVRSQVHPAVLHYGGPVGLRDQATVTPGAQVITYGHSGQRAPNDPENPREGHVYQVTQDNQVAVMTNYPGIHGDSGSGLMDADGNALGVLSTKISEQPAMWEEREFPTVNYYVSLHENLERARQGDPGLAGLEIVTWDLLAAPALPVSLPGPVPPIPP